MMNLVAKELKNENKIKFAKNKLNSFWEQYFSGQKQFIEILNNEYLI